MDRQASHQRALALTVVVLVLFSGFEFGVGLAISGTSLVLEAVHNSVDIGSYWAVRMAGKDNRVWLSRASSAVLVLTAVPFIFWGFRDLGNPHVSNHWVALTVSLIGLGVNLWIANRLHPFREAVHEVAGLLHALGDVAASLAAVAGYTVIVLSGADAADPIAAIVGATVVVVLNTIAAVFPDNHHHEHEH